MTKTTPKPFVFVLMPFSNEFHDVYNLGIKVAAEASETYCERVDEQVYDGTILQRIYNQIRTADIIVADMTGRNANVFYEVGYAHALDKKVILLTKDPEDIPFDLKHYPHIIYPSVSSLRDELTKRLNWIVKNPKETSDYFTSPLRIFSKGKLIQREMHHHLERYNGNNISKFNLNFEVDIHNSTDQTLSSSTFMLGLIIPTRFDYVTAQSGENYPNFPVRCFEQNDGTALHLIREEFCLLPGSWEKFYWTLNVAPGIELTMGEEIDLTIRLLTHAGINDNPVTLTLE